MTAKATRIHSLTCPTLDALHARAVSDGAHALAWSLTGGAEVLQVERRAWVWRQGEEASVVAGGAVRWAAGEVVELDSLPRRA